MAGRLAGRKVIVTGAARGIGAAIARQFAAEGAILGLLDLDGEALTEVVEDLRGTGAEVADASADIGDPAALGGAMAGLAGVLGGIDVLVNNAGINVFRDPLAMTDEDWRRCMAVNLEGAWNCIRMVLPCMLKAGGGSIVNIASTHAFAIIRGTFPYPVAKHALVGLTRSLAVEYAGKGVRLNAIAPGYIETDKVREWLENADDPAAERKRIETMIPLGRIGRPEQVAWAAVYLASDESTFTTGSILTMDGGRSIVYHD